MLSTREGYWRLKAQGFYWELVTEAPSALHIPKFQTPRQKVGVQHKLYCLYSLDTVNHSDQFCEWGEPPQIQVSRCQPRTSLAIRAF